MQTGFVSRVPNAAALLLQAIPNAVLASCMRCVFSRIFGADYRIVVTQEEPESFAIWLTSAPTQTLRRTQLHQIALGTLAQWAVTSSMSFLRNEEVQADAEQKARDHDNNNHGGDEACARLDPI